MNKTAARGIIGLLMIATLLVLPGFACQGNACADIKPSVNGNCHTLKNVGNRSIRVKWGDSFGPKDLAPGESWTITNINGACVGYIAGDITANYI